MTTYKNITVPPDFVSDGCTSARDSWFGVSITEACKWHDFVKRYGLLNTWKADFYVYSYFIKIGHPLFKVFISHFYLVGMLWNTFTQIGVEPKALPEEWKQYAPD